jgi:hypothetical protein
LKNLAIVGSAPSTRERIDWSDPNLDIWVYNEVLSRPGWCKRADAVWQIHPEPIWRTEKNRSDANHCNWLMNKSGECLICKGSGKYMKEGQEKTCESCNGSGQYVPIGNRESVSIYMLEAYQDVLNAIKVPKDEIVSALLPNFTVDSKRGRKDFFTSTIAYSLALGVYLGYKKIDLFGIELADEEEYRNQQPAAMFWIGIGIGRGVEITAHSGMFDMPLYPTETFVGVDKQIFIDKVAVLAPQCDLQQKHYEATANKASLLVNKFEEAGNVDVKEIEAAILERAEEGEKYGILDGARQENERYLARANAMEKASGTYIFSKHEFMRDFQAIANKRQEVKLRIDESAAQARAILYSIKPKLFDGRRRKAFETFRQTLEQYIRYCVIYAIFSGAMNEDEGFIKLVEDKKEVT